MSRCPAAVFAWCATASSGASAGQVILTIDVQCTYSIFDEGIALTLDQIEDFLFVEIDHPVATGELLLGDDGGTHNLLSHFDVLLLDGASEGAFTFLPFYILRRI